MRCFIFIVGVMLFACAGISQNISPDIDKFAHQLDTLIGKTARANLYLSTSKKIYVSGEDLWFNAIILDAQTLTLSGLDKTLYLQLLQRGSDSTVWEEMYAIKGGISSGQVYLPETLQEGDYFLRAFSANSYIPGQPYFYTIAPIKIVKDMKAIRRVVRQVAGVSKQKSIIQLGVFPEGGNLVMGLQNQLVFKAVNSSGTPVEVEGTVLEDNQPIAGFTTSHAGMGKMSFTPGQKASYQIRLKNSDSLYAIPKMQQSGFLIHLLKNDGDSLAFKIFTTHTPQKKKIFLRLQIRGIVQSVAMASITDSLEIKLPIKNSLQGIAEVTLFDDRFVPVCERLVYLHPDRKLRINVSQVMQQYLQKEKISIKIKTTDDLGNALPAVVSLKVYDQLFDNPNNTNDIVNYFLLSTQLRGKINNPAYYFDTTHPDRQEALDLLLLTQGWRRYVWNEEYLKQQHTHAEAILSDSLPVFLSTAKGTKKEQRSASILLFNYNKSIHQFAVIDSSSKFFLTPENLAIGPRLFIKYFSDKTYAVQVQNPFERIHEMETRQKIDYIFAERTFTEKIEEADSTNLLQYGTTLDAVTITAKGHGYNDKYLGYLDSIAKFEANTDFVGVCGWLNCPACGHGTKPVEGVTYSELTAEKKGQVSSHPYTFTQGDFKTAAYHYPKYTEEELLTKFKMAMTKGYFKSKEFYEPDYDIEDRSIADNRNTIAWNPSVITDQNGEATLSFYSSDIRSGFTGILEGTGGEGLLGVTRIFFSVK